MRFTWRWQVLIGWNCLQRRRMSLMIKNNLANQAHHAKTVEISGVFWGLRGVPVGTPRHTTCGTARRGTEVGSQRSEIRGQEGKKIRNTDLRWSTLLDENDVLGSSFLVAR